jgi:hypothetical protein
MLLKGIAGIAILLITIVIAGVSGLSFRLWPTDLVDHRLSVTLAGFDTPESEERDQLLVYLTRVMTICGVENSSELFNVWRYGFPYGWMSR